MVLPFLAWRIIHSTRRAVDQSSSDRQGRVSSAPCHGLPVRNELLKPARQSFAARHLAALVFEIGGVRAFKAYRHQRRDIEGLLGAVQLLRAGENGR